MAGKDEKNKPATPVAVEATKQPEGAGGQQLAAADNPVPGADAGPAVLTGTETAEPAAPAADAVIPADPVPDAVAPLPPADGERSHADTTLLEQLQQALARERYTVQAVAVPNNRRMRGGRVFTHEPQTVSRDDFTDEQWKAIRDDLHLKVIALDGEV